MNDLIHLFEEKKLDNFHILREVTGRMLNCELRLNTAVHPGYQAALFTLVKNREKIAAVLESIREYNRSNETACEKVHALTWKVEDWIYD